MKKFISIFTFYTLLTIIMTWPLLPNVTTKTLSMIGKGQDIFLNIWILEHDVHSILTDLKSYWNGNIFYPLQRTKAYSEHMTGLLPLYLPVRLITGNSLIAYNCTTLLAFILCGVAMCYLVLSLTGSLFAGIFSGIVYAFSQNRFGQIEHIQLLVSFWVPLIFLWFQTTMKCFHWKVLILACVAALLQMLSSGYILLMLNLFLLLYFLCIIYYNWNEDCRKIIKKSIAALFLVFILVLPFLIPYYRVNKEMEMTRTLGESRYFSARITSYISASPANKIWGKLTSGLASYRTKMSEAHEIQLFIGLLPLIFAILGIWKLFKERNFLQPIEKSFFIFIFVGLFLSIIFSFYYPFSLLFKFIPGFSGLRVPARFSIFTMFFVGVLAGYGAAWIFNTTRFSKNKMFNTLSKTFCCLLLIGELFVAPLHLNSIPIPSAKNKKDAALRWLAQQPDNSPVLELPVSDFNNARYILNSTFHWNPLVNGISGYYPRTHEFIDYIIRTRFPSISSLNFFINLGVKYILIHEDLMPKEDFLLLRNKLRNIYKQDMQSYALRLHNPSSDRALEPNFSNFQGLQDSALNYTIERTDLLSSMEHKTINHPIKKITQLGSVLVVELVSHIQPKMYRGSPRPVLSVRILEPILNYAQKKTLFEQNIKKKKKGEKIVISASVLLSVAKTPIKVYSLLLNLGKYWYLYPQGYEVYGVTPNNRRFTLLAISVDDFPPIKSFAENPNNTIFEIPLSAVPVKTLLLRTYTGDSLLPDAMIRGVKRYEVVQ